MHAIRNLHPQSYFHNRFPTLPSLEPTTIGLGGGRSPRRPRSRSAAEFWLMQHVSRRARSPGQVRPETGRGSCRKTKYYDLVSLAIWLPAPGMPGVPGYTRGRGTGTQCGGLSSYRVVLSCLHRMLESEGTLLSRRSNIIFGRRSVPSAGFAVGACNMR